MALSLLAVSCTKDKNPTNPNPPVENPEGGSGSGGGSGETPTNPITIDAATLDEAIKKIGNYSYPDSGSDNPILNIDFSSFNSKDRKDLTASIGGGIDNYNNVSNFKRELENILSFSSVGFTATATAEMPNNFNSQDPVTVTVVIDAGNNTFADDVKTAYTVTGKKATVEITINPDDNKKWDGKK